MRLSKSLPHLCLFFSFSALALVEGRLWTDLDGRGFEGELVKFTEETVTISFPDQTEATVPIQLLSAADGEFLKTQTEVKITPPPKDAILKDGLNWNDPWPEQIALDERPEIIIEIEDRENERFVYTSPNYRFTCDVRLTQSVVSNFARMFEATHDYCRAIPLALTAENKKNGKYDILLFETREAYVEAGGPPTSGGVFIGGRGKNYIMVPLTSLGVQKFGSSYRRDRDKSDGTLIHEITHQLTPSPYYRVGARGWFTEGLAEYVAATPYRNGRFKVARNLDDILEYFSAWGKDGTRGRALGEEFSAPALRDFMLLPYSEFTGDNANFNYGFGLVLSTYFFHFDGEGDGFRIKRFLATLRNANRNEWGKEAAKKHLEILLDGRTWSEVEAEIEKAWRRKGVKISFRPEAVGTEY